MNRLSRMLVLGLSLVVSVASLRVAAEEFVLGQDYESIVPAQPVDESDGRIEVVELFWYGCPHCHRFEPYIERWVKRNKDRIHFVRLPAILRNGWAVHARAFYAAEALGVAEKIHKPLFDAIHNQRRKLDDEDSLARFFASQGVDEGAFRRAFESFGVDSQVRRAKQMTRRYRAMGTPAVVVDGKYLTDPGMARGFPRLIEVIDYLVGKEERARKSSS